MKSKNKSKWIPKESGMPSGMLRAVYLCVCDYEHDQVGIAIRTSNWMIKTMNDNKNTWTHYMELPEKPQRRNK